MRSRALAALHTERTSVRVRATFAFVSRPDRDTPSRVRLSKTTSNLVGSALSRRAWRNAEIPPRSGGPFPTRRTRLRAATTSANPSGAAMSTLARLCEHHHGIPGVLPHRGPPPEQDGVQAIEGPDEPREYRTISQGYGSQ